MRLMNCSRAVWLGVVFAVAACTGTSASKPAAAPESTASAATAATAGTASAQAPAPAGAQAPLREPDVIYVPTPHERRGSDAEDGERDRERTWSTTSARATAGFRSPRRRSTARAPSASTSIRSASRKRTRTSPRPNVGDKVKFLNQDLFETDLSQATVITLYLLPSLNQKLMPKLKQLKPGTRIVSHSFDMGTAWPPEKTEDVQGRVIYYWTIK